MIVYSDIHPQLAKNKVGDLSLVTNYDAIEASIDNILGTEFRERVMLPEFGARISQYLFDIISESTARMIKNEIMMAVHRWEPRIKTNSVSIIPNKEEHLYEIEIDYEVIGLQFSGRYYRKLVLP